MKLTLTALAVTLVLVSSPAFAFQCPKDAAAIDAALAAGTSLSDAEVAEVKALRDEGMAQHEAGDHGQSVETLAKALKMLGLQ